MLLNLLIPIASFAIVSIMGLFMTPFFINNFGYDGLGLISNSNALIQSLFFAGGAFTTVYARLYAKAQDIKDREILLIELNKILSFLGLIALLLSMSLYIYSISKKNVVFEYYSLTLFAASIIIICQSFSVFPFAKNKIFINSLVDCCRTFLRNAFCLILFYLFVDNIYANGWAMIISALLSLLMLSILYKENKLFSFGRINFNDNLKNSLWVCLNQGGAYLFSFSDIFLVNFMLGHYIGGVYALLIQIPALLKAVSIVAIGSTSSFIVKFNAKYGSDKKIITKICNQNILFFSFFISNAFIIISSYKELLFSLWVPSGVNDLVLEYFDVVCFIMMLLSITSLINTFLAGWGFFSFPAKVTLCAAVISLVIILFLYNLGVSVSIYIIFGVIYLTLILKNIICFAYFYIVVGLRLHDLIYGFLLCALVILTNLAIVKVIRYCIFDDYMSLSIIVLVAGVLSIPLLSYFKRLRDYI
ncbi:hypothetical protein R3J21_02055 [Citrobacter werkmanii]|uniref:hypothetical protein n=1 Tax=Citrobacter werkmanii TaxID=67827 RepID=UPI002954BCAA|nr:hypothetical protein [Citrobacter werkmanii]MDV7070327.1 hypothetical protein [Citrobacter werkmanii]